MRMKSEWRVRLMLVGVGVFPLIMMALAGGLAATHWAVGLGGAVLLPLVLTGPVCDWLFRTRLARLKQWCAAVRLGEAPFWDNLPNESRAEDCWLQLHRDLNWLLHRLRQQIAKTDEQRLQAETAYCRMRQLALVDPLTKLANRRHFQEHLRLEWRRDQQSTNQLALVMIDLDHFKRINDQYGHDTGDQVLRRVGRKLSAIAKPPHLAARIGGEEFVVILNGLNEQAAKAFASRIHCSLQDEWETAEGRVGVTCSIGGCAVGGKLLPDGDDVLKKADLALYAGKRSGRNCICWWDWQTNQPFKMTQK